MGRLVVVLPPLRATRTIDKAFADADKLKYWMPVDWYNGGMEHVTRHMIYSRFWHKFLYDIGEVPVTSRMRSGRRRD